MNTSTPVASRTPKGLALYRVDSCAGARRKAGGAHMCNMCGRTFAVSKRLDLHYLRVHAGERPFECEVCGNNFAVKSSLVVHRKIHTREKPYKCSKCNEEFESSAKLQRHMLVHTEEQPHRCTVCGEFFIQSCQLVFHMRKHTGEKPYVCSVCNKGFACSTRLRVHSRIHASEQPFVCDFCDKAFTYKQGLKLHLVVHFGDRRLYTSKKALEEYLIANGLSGTPKKSTLSQQDSGAAVVSSSSPNPSNTRNPCDVGNDMFNRIIVECLNSSTPKQSRVLPHDLPNNSRYTSEKNHRQLSVSMLFGCSAVVNQTNTDRAKELLSNNNFQVSQVEKQQQGCFTNQNYSKVHHHDFDSMDFRHIPPLIPI